MNEREMMRQLRRALKAFAQTVPDEQAATFPSLYDKWKPGEVVKPGDRRYDTVTEKVYKVNDGMGHTTQEDWPPHLTPAMWTVIDVAHSGTEADPIPASRGMEYTYGLYYTDPEDGKLYICKRTGATDGDKITLHFLPHELVGQYFEEVTE